MNMYNHQLMDSVFLMLWINMIRAVSMIRLEPIIE